MAQKLDRFEAILLSSGHLHPGRVGEAHVVHHPIILLNGWRVVVRSLGIVKLILFFLLDVP